jgi:ATP-dependent DNA helicase RecG
VDDKELRSLLRELESDRVERKASAADMDKIRKAVCAFANDLPAHGRAGVVFIGATDDGRCANLKVTDELLRKLTEVRHDVLPFPSLVVQSRRLAGCEMAILVVEPSDAPPVRYDGRVYVRVGPTTRVATLEEERRLSEKRRAHDLPFDIWPVRSARLADLDINVFRLQYLPFAVPSDLLEQNQRDVTEQLVSLRFANSGDPPVPTVLGVLVVGRDPRAFIPGAYVQFIRIQGTELTDPIKDQKEIGGPLPDLLRMLDETLQVHVEVASDIASGAVERRRPDYPIAALQQLARNGVMHRSYDGTNAPTRITWFADRIEIQNPGGPYGQVTRENFGQAGTTDYRNPHLAEVMKNLGYVQRFGLGIPLARAELAKNGNPPPEFAAEAAHVLVIIRRRQ